MPFNSGTMSWSKKTASKQVAPAQAEVPATDEHNELVEIVASLSVAEVKELVESGEASLADVIEAEKAGKSRATILSFVQADSGKVYPKQQD